MVCDNGGYAVINRLQNYKGGAELQQPDQGLPRQGAVRRGLRQARRIDGGAGARRRRASPNSGQAMDWAKTHRPHHRHLTIVLRCLHLDAGRCLVGCRRAAGQRTRKAVHEAAKDQPEVSQETARRRLDAVQREWKAAQTSGDCYESEIGIAPIAWWNDDLAGTE